MPSVAQTRIVGTRCGSTWREQDAPRSGADGTARLDELPLGQRGGLGVDHAGDLHPVHQRDHQGHDPQGRLEDRRQRDREEQGREGHHQVGQAHDRGTEPAAQIAGDDSEHRAEQDGDAVRDDADQQRGARAVDQAREQVAAEQVGAEPEVPVGRQRRALERQAVEELLVRRVRGKLGCQYRGEDRDQDDGEPEHRQPGYETGAPAAFGDLTILGAPRCLGIGVVE